MVGVEVQVPVHVACRQFIQAAIVTPPEQGVKKEEVSVPLHFHNEADGQFTWHTIHMLQESFYFTPLHNRAVVIRISLPEAELYWSCSECQLLKNSIYRSATTTERDRGAH